MPKLHSASSGAHAQCYEQAEQTTSDNDSAPAKQCAVPFSALRCWHHLLPENMYGCADEAETDSTVPHMPSNCSVHNKYDSCAGK